MSEQLTFSLPVRESRERGDFFVSEANALAVARLDGVADWPSGKMVLVGPEGSGKSHLAHTWTEAQGAGPVATLSDLPETDILSITEPLAIDIEDHLLPTTGAAEEALFHVHNHMQSHHLPLLLIARQPPAQWDIALPDLKSRMEATDIVRIAAPDDSLLAALFVKQFSDRQLIVSPKVIAWLIEHMDRSFAEVQRITADLDQLALSEGRKITTKLARRVVTRAPEE